MVEQLGTLGCRHVQFAGSFENPKFWNKIFFALRTALIHTLFRGSLSWG